MSSLCGIILCVLCQCYLSIVSICPLFTFRLTLRHMHAVNVSLCWFILCVHCHCRISTISVRPTLTFSNTMPHMHTFTLLVYSCVFTVTFVCSLSAYVHCSLLLTLLVIPVCPVSVLYIRCQHMSAVHFYSDTASRTCCQCLYSAGSPCVSSVSVVSPMSVHVLCSRSVTHYLTCMQTIPPLCGIILCVNYQSCLSTVSIYQLLRHMLHYMQSMHSLCCLIPVCPLSMKDEELSGLAMISIESDMARRLDITHVMNTFATSKVKKPL